MREPRILFFDIETAPSLGWVWGKWQQDVIQFEKYWFILSVSWKWLGDNNVYFLHSDGENDYQVVEKLWELLDEADVVVAHNGDDFDIKRANARFVAYNCKPPAPYKTIDTLKVAKKHFKFESNSLNDLARYLEIGEKAPTVGFKLWQGCIQNDPDSWKQMEVYNRQDVLLLEKLYLRLRPWMASHPNLNLFSGSVGCPNCSSTHVQRRGFSYARVQIRQRFNCQACGAWFSGAIEKRSILEK